MTWQYDKEYSLMFEDDKDLLERIRLYVPLLGAHLCRVLKLVDLESSRENVSADLFEYRASTPEM